ncbi:putative vacuolar protein sorting-associated protein Ist1 [Helianthus anomalus]
MVATYDLIEISCEFIVGTLPIIKSQKTCAIDLKEAVTSVICAAPRCSDIFELYDVRRQFTAKYGKYFVSAAIELHPDCGVSRMVSWMLMSWFYLWVALMRAWVDGLVSPSLNTTCLVRRVKIPNFNLEILRLWGMGRGLGRGLGTNAQVTTPSGLGFRRGPLGGGFSPGVGRA